MKALNFLITYFTAIEWSSLAMKNSKHMVGRSLYGFKIGV